MTHSRIALVEAAQRGRPDAIDTLLSVCQPDIRRFARRTCNHAEDAEDAAQAALWQLYRKVGALRTAATLTTWLFRIVERECFRLFRQRTRLDVETDADIDSVAAPGVPHSLRLDLVKAIAALPAPYRVVLVLRDIDELTAPEVAARLGIGLQAVKSRLHRARTMVRERLIASDYWSATAGEDAQ